MKILLLLLLLVVVVVLLLASAWRSGLIRFWSWLESILGIGFVDFPIGHGILADLDIPDILAVYMKISCCCYCCCCC